MDYQSSRSSSRQTSRSSPRQRDASGRLREGSQYIKMAESERRREVPQGRSGYNRTRDHGVSTKGRSGYN
ncbi:hypothetical protein CKAH01_14800 [Colletotrichum kahawae]|uniref:Uncharacterized protein n=1 Tax=Colletotrichum kahawae TaxID=34407 RepID=A0AAD9YK01_COLKA|nr:hypothetical protein CKAH01_14800 [Colletotrichum kahawae]